jgi:hypothetical protein
MAGHSNATTGLNDDRGGSFPENAQAGSSRLQLDLLRGNATLHDRAIAVTQHRL